MASIIGGLYGSEQAKPYEEKQAALIEEALQGIKDVNVPTVEEQQIALQKLVSAGEITPEMLETISLGDSAMEGVSTDPRLAKAQMNALESLAKQGEEGLTSIDRAALNSIRGDVARESRGREGAILQSMAARGMGGSGAELAAQLGSSQAASQQAAEASDRMAAMAQQRALEARAQSGQLGGQMRSQEFGEKSQVAQARDAIERFNAANRQQVASTNVGSRNLAQQQNLANQQRIADANAGLTNQQEMYNKGLIGQQYGMNMGKAGAVSNALGSVAGMQGDKAQQELNKWLGMGQGVDQAIGTGVATALKVASDKRVKKDILPGEKAIEKLLGHLDSFEFSYKDEANGKGKRLGVMAQDVEKSPEGKKLVSEDEGTKQIDIAKAVSTLLAAAGNLNKRIKKLEGNNNG